MAACATKPSSPASSAGPPLPAARTSTPPRPARARAEARHRGVGARVGRAQAGAGDAAVVGRPPAAGEHRRRVALPRGERVDELRLGDAPVVAEEAHRRQRRRRREAAPAAAVARERGGDARDGGAVRGGGAVGARRAARPRGVPPEAARGVDGEVGVGELDAVVDDDDARARAARGVPRGGRAHQRQVPLRGVERVARAAARRRLEHEVDRGAAARAARRQQQQQRQQARREREREGGARAVAFCEGRRVAACPLPQREKI